MAVGAERQPSTFGGEGGHIVSGTQQGVVEVAQEELFDQLDHGAATTTMAHLYCPVFKVEWGIPGSHGTYSLWWRNRP